MSLIYPLEHFERRVEQRVRQLFKRKEEKPVAAESLSDKEICQLTTEIFT